MKLRIDMGIFLFLFFLSSTLTYSNDYFAMIPKLNTVEVVEETNIIRSTSGGGGGSSRVREEYTLEVYDYSDTIWTFEEGVQNGLYFLPGNISKYATTITKVDVSNENVVLVDWDLDEEFDVIRVWFRPKNPGLTNVTIYVENDKGEKGRTTFKIETRPYQRPIAAEIEHQYIEVGEIKSFTIRQLLENGNDIWAEIKGVSSANLEIAEAYLDDSQRLITIKGLSKGETTITAHVRNMSELGVNDLIPVQIPITVTQAVYGN